MRSYNFVKRKISNDKFLYIVPDSLFWIITNSNNTNVEKFYNHNLHKNLVSKLNYLHNRVKLELIEVHLTENCNINCKYCYVPLQFRKSSSIMDYNLLKLIILKSIQYSKETKYPIPRILFHGGEPLLAFELISKIIKEFGSLIKFSIQTNGLLIDKMILNFLIKNNVNIGISVDPSKSSRTKQIDIYDFASKYKKWIENIAILSTLTKENINHLLDFIKVIHTLGFKSIVLNPVSPENEKALKLIVPEDKLIETYKKAISLTLYLNKKYSNKLILDNLEGFFLPLISDYTPIYCRMSPCGAGRLNIVITAEGDVYPCSGFIAFNDFKMGNIIEMSFQEILYSDTAIQLRNRNSNLIEQCTFCPYKRICGANCPLPLLFLYNDLLKKSFYCKFYCAVIDYLIELYFKDKSIINFLLSDKYIYHLKKSPFYYRINEWGPS